MIVYNYELFRKNEKQVYCKKYNPKGKIDEQQVEELKEILKPQSVIYQQPAMEFRLCE